MNNFLKISQQTLWQILGKVVTSLSTFIILGLVARNYGEEGTGVFTLALTYLAIFYLLSDFGFNAHVLKKFSIFNFQFSIEWRKLLGTRIIWSMMLVILAVGLLPFWPFTTQEFFLAVLIGSLAILASSVFVTCNLIFQSKLRYDLSVLALSIGTLLGLGIFVWLVLINLPIPYLLFAHLVSWAAVAVVALFLIYGLTKAVPPLYDIQYTKYLFKKSWPIAATLGLNVIYFRADSFMVAYFKGVSDAGIYNIAYSVFQSALVLPTFIMNAYYPMMLKSLKGIRLVGLGLFLLAGCGTMLTLLLAPFIITILTGSGFAGSPQALQILSLGFPAYFLSALLMWVMVTRGQYKKMLVVYGLGLIINVGANLIFIPQYSFFAASYMTVISEYLILGMQGVVLFFERSEKIP